MKHGKTQFNQTLEQALSTFHYIHETSKELDPEIIGKFITSNMVSFTDVGLYFPPYASEIKPMIAKFKEIRNAWTTPAQPPRFQMLEFTVTKICPKFIQIKRGKTSISSHSSTRSLFFGFQWTHSICSSLFPCFQNQ